MYTQRNKTKNNSEAQRAGLLGFSVSSNCSPFGVPICFLKKNYFSFVNVSRKQSARSLGAPPPVSRAELGISLTLFLSCFLKAKVQVQKWASFAFGF